MPREILIGSAALIIGSVIFIIVLVVSIFLFTKLLAKFFAGGMGKTIDAGEIASAKILQVEQGRLKMTVGGVQEYWQPNITLRVDPRGSHPYETTIKHVVSVLDIPQYQPGAVVIVGIDKSDINRVGIINNIAADLASVKAPEGQKDKAERMLIDYEIDYIELSNTGVKAKAEITKVTDPGIATDKGVMRYLSVRVEAPDNTPFEAEILALIKETSLPKYVPPATVNVAYGAGGKRIALLGLDEEQPSG